MLLSIPALAIQFPDTTALQKEYVLKTRTKGLPKEYVSGDQDPMTIRLTWSKKKKIQKISYEKTSSFTDGEFEKIASSLGGGAIWHEFPLSKGDSTLYNQYPGLEQHWVLKGFQNETGWMGSGLLNNTFFLTFTEKVPIKQKTISEPLRVQKGFVSKLKTSGDWVPSDCKPKSPDEVCYLHVTNANLLAKWDGKDTSQFEIWLYSSKNIEDIEDALKSLTPDDYSAYARELPNLSNTETHSFLNSLSQTHPKFFNWPSWQLQELKVGLVGWGVYHEIFKIQGTDWPFIPIFKLEDRDLSLKIRLYFNGSYQMIVKQ